MGPVELEQPEVRSAPALVLSHGTLQPSLQPGATGTAGAAAAEAGAGAGAVHWANGSLPLHLRYASPTSDGSSFRAFTLPPPLLFVGCAAAATHAADDDADADAATAAASADATADADADADGARLPPAGCPPLELIGKAWADVCAPAAPPPAPRRLGGFGSVLTWHVAALVPEGAGGVDPGVATASDGDGDGAGGRDAAEEGGVGATPLAGGLLALVPVGQVSK